MSPAQSIAIATESTFTDNKTAAAVVHSRINESSNDDDKEDQDYNYIYKDFLRLGKHSDFRIYYTRLLIANDHMIDSFIIFDQQLTM